MEVWRDRQLPRAVIWTSQTGHTYTTYPGRQASVLSNRVHPPARCGIGEPPVVIHRERGVMMPKRRHTRAHNTAKASRRAERRLNYALVAETKQTRVRCVTNTDHEGHHWALFGERVERGLCGHRNSIAAAPERRRPAVLQAQPKCRLTAQCADAALRLTPAGLAGEGRSHSAGTAALRTVEPRRTAREIVHGASGAPLGIRRTARATYGCSPAAAKRRLRRTSARYRVKQHCEA